MTEPHSSLYQALGRGGPGEVSFGGGRTDWAGLGIDEIIDILHTMDPGSAAGDVNTILQAIEAVRRAADRLEGLFADDGLRGRAADAAVQAGQELSAAMHSTLDSATLVGDALGDAAAVVGAARGQEGHLQELRRRLRERPEDAPGVRYEADRLMGSTYSSPMQRVQHRISTTSDGPAATVVGLGGTGGSAFAGSSGADSARGQAANTVDAGDFGRRGSPAAPAAVPTPAPGTGGPPPGPATPVAPTPPASSTSGGRGQGDDPDGLRRGARATPEGAGERASSGGPSTEGVGGGGEIDGGAGGLGDDPRAEGLPGAMAPMPMLPPWASPPAGAAASSASPGIPGPRPITPAAGPLGAPPVGRRGGSDDERHKTAPYLHNREHGAEIVGALPLVGPPVVGDWLPVATTATGPHADPATAREPAPSPQDPTVTPGRTGTGPEPATGRDGAPEDAAAVDDTPGTGPRPSRRSDDA